MTATTETACTPDGCHAGDCLQCMDCGAVIHARGQCYAVDCGVCVPCGRQRYGDDDEHMLGPVRGYEAA